MKSKFILTILITGVLLSSGCQKKASAQQEEIIPAEKLGQLIVVGFRGTQINGDSSIAKAIKKYNVGGVVLFDYDVQTGDTTRNIESPAQLRRLSSTIVEYSPTPPVIAVDQEGGNVVRLKKDLGFSKSVTAYYLGELDIEDSTRYYARKMAQELSATGVNTNFAPVVDVNTNPDNPIVARYGRSFSPDPKEVTEHAGYVIDEFDSKGILTVLKHFPGHGSSKDDTHLGVTDVTDTWSKKELIPYKKLFAEKNIHAVMTAHIYNANIDSVWPATLSEKTINVLLRDSLGFNGVVFSDDMQMEAIRSEYGLETAIQQALNAGVDILVFGNNLVYEKDIAEKAIKTIQKLLREGKVKKQTVEKALARIDTLKQNVIAEFYLD